MISKQGKAGAGETSFRFGEPFIPDGQGRPRLLGLGLDPGGQLAVQGEDKPAAFERGCKRRELREREEVAAFGRTEAGPAFRQNGAVGGELLPAEVAGEGDSRAGPGWIKRGLDHAWPASRSFATSVRNSAHSAASEAAEAA